MRTSPKLNFNHALQSVEGEVEPPTTSLPMPQAKPKVAKVLTRAGKGVAIAFGTPVRAYSSNMP